MKNQIKNNSIILLCGHGSRSRAHSQNLIKVKKKIEKNINQKILHCYLEVNKPSLEECLIKYSNNFDKVLIFPFFIFEGKHFKEDVKNLLNKYNNKLNKIILLDKISLLNEILPLTLKILKNKINNRKRTILVTSASYSKDNSVFLDLKKYTETLSLKLKLKESFFHFVGDEKKVIEKLKLIKNNDLSILLHPIFLFQGFLYSKKY